jgi:hypothetical protein
MAVVWVDAEEMGVKENDIYIYGSLSEFPPLRKFCIYLTQSSHPEAGDTMSIHQTFVLYIT